MRVRVRKVCNYRVDASTRRHLPIGWTGEIADRHALQLAQDGSVDLLDVEAKPAARNKKATGGAKASKGDGSNGAEAGQGGEGAGDGVNTAAAAG